MRKIRIFSTNGVNTTIETSAETFGELKNELIERDEYVDFENSKCVENIRRTTIESDEAQLPTEDFKLFIRPKSSKLGANTSDVEFALEEFKEAAEYVCNQFEALLESMEDNNATPVDSETEELEREAEDIFAGI